MDKNNYGSPIEWEQILALNVNGETYWERKCKNGFFAYIFVKSWSNYVKPRPKWSPAHSAHIVKYILSTEMLRISDNLQSVIIRENRISQRPPGKLLNMFVNDD